MTASKRPVSKKRSQKSWQRWRGKWSCESATKVSTFSWPMNSLRQQKTRAPEQLRVSSRLVRSKKWNPKLRNSTRLSYTRTYEQRKTWGLLPNEKTNSLSIYFFSKKCVVCVCVLRALILHHISLFIISSPSAWKQLYFFLKPSYINWIDIHFRPVQWSSANPPFKTNQNLCPSFYHDFISPWLYILLGYFFTFLKLIYYWTDIFDKKVSDCWVYASTARMWILWRRNCLKYIKNKLNSNG